MASLVVVLVLVVFWDYQAALELIVLYFVAAFSDCIFTLLLPLLLTQSLPSNYAHSCQLAHLLFLWPPICP